MSRRALPLLVVVLLLAPAAAARAGTVSLSSFTAGRGDDTFRVAVYRAAPGETNDVVASTQAGPDDSLYGVVHDTAGVTAGAGCEPLVPADPDAARCLLSSPSSLEYPDSFSAAPEAFHLVLGDRGDRATIAPAHGIAGRLDGGPGHDVLSGGTGGGEIDEDTPSLSGNDLRGGPGADVLHGGANDDMFHERDAGASDRMTGGGGRDIVDYTGRRAALRIDLRAGRVTGPRGERDHLTGIDGAAGGRGRDTLLANDRGDVLEGGPGRDTLVGGRGDDTLTGGRGSAVFNFFAPNRRDHAGNVLRGGGGDDELVGAAGADVITPGPGRDDVLAGPGADRVRARDRAHDEVSCARGRDRAALDGVDWSTGCERRTLTGAPRVVFVGFTDVLTAPGTVAQLELGCSPDYPTPRCPVRATIRIGGRVAGGGGRTVRRGLARDVIVPLTRFGRRQLRAHGTVHARLTLVTPEPGRRPARYALRIRLVT